MIRAAIVGVSGYGRWHLLMAMEQALVGRLRLVAATIINEKEEEMIGRRLRQHGVPVFDDYCSMLNALKGQIDLVLLPTAIHAHASMTHSALSMGAHVLVEKPVAATLQDADAIIAAQVASRRAVAVGFQELYLPSAHAIQRRLIDGELGRVRRIVVRAQWPRSEAYYQRNEWAGRIRVKDAWVLDSPINNGLAHFITLAFFWAAAEPGTLAEVTDLHAELYRAHPIESFDTICLRTRMTTGIEVCFYGSHAGTEEVRPEVHVLADDGELRWRYESNCVIRRRGHTAQMAAVPTQMETRLNVLDSLVRHIREPGTFIVTPQLARTHTRLVNALHEFFPIISIARQHGERTEPAAVFREIPRLGATFDEAAARGALFSEIGVPWAVPSKAVSLHGYQSFRGTFDHRASERMAAPP